MERHFDDFRTDATLETHTPLLQQAVLDLISGASLVCRGRSGDDLTLTLD